MLGALKHDMIGISDFMPFFIFLSLGVQNVGGKGEWLLPYPVGIIFDIRFSTASDVHNRKFVSRMFTFVLLSFLLRYSCSYLPQP